MAGEARNGQGASRFSYKQMALYGVMLAVASVLVVFVFGAFMAVSDMRHEADVSIASALPRVEGRIDETFKLLETLAERETLYDPDVDVMTKVDLVDKVNEHFGFFLLCYVDAGINVWDATGPASLASRSHMQRVYSTGERYVTDSFVAGADGTTLNYTVIVPLRDGRGAMTGSLFASIYFDEMVEMLDESRASSYVESLIVGGKGQVDVRHVGTRVRRPLPRPHPRHHRVRHDRRRRAARAVGAQPGDVLDRRRIRRAILHRRILWLGTAVGRRMRGELLGRVRQGHGRARLPAGHRRRFGGRRRGAFLLLRRPFARQMENARLLGEVRRGAAEESVRPTGDRPKADIADILELTSSGLSDGLTGTVTRSVFSSQLASALDNARRQRIPVRRCASSTSTTSRTINDTFGHATGDAALEDPSAYALRGYERRYDGMVGRYGGDEFALLMTDFDDEAELRAVLDEITGRPSREHPGGRCGGLGALQRRRDRVGPGFRRRCAFGAGRQRSVSRQAAW